MSRKDFESPEELIDLEGRFLDNYEEMNNFIIFFNKIQEILTSNEKVKALEINLSRICKTLESFSSGITEIYTLA